MLHGPQLHSKSHGCGIGMTLQILSTMMQLITQGLVSLIPQHPSSHSTSRTRWKAATSASESAVPDLAGFASVSIAFSIRSRRSSKSFRSPFDIARPPLYSMRLAYHTLLFSYFYCQA